MASKVNFQTKPINSEVRPVPTKQTEIQICNQILILETQIQPMFGLIRRDKSPWVNFRFFSESGIDEFEFFFSL